MGDYYEGQKNIFFKFDEKFVENSFLNSEKEEGYEDFVKIIEALGKL